MTLPVNQPPIGGMTVCPRVDAALGVEVPELGVPEPEKLFTELLAAVRERLVSVA